MKWMHSFIVRTPHSRERSFIPALLLGLWLIFSFYGTGLAHGHTEVGDYELSIGFITEPAYQGEPNGLDLSVTHMVTGEPVSGLEGTLQVEVIFGAARKELEIEPRFGEEGAYTAHLIPTAAGDYTWHIFGQIEDTPVDVSMTSGPDTFSPVEPKASAAFPAAEPDPGALRTQSQIALILGGAGVLLGIAGLAAGLSRSRLARG